MDIKSPPDSIIGTINHCIYCDEDGRSGPLSDEHVVPLAYGGHRILEKASCPKCADITGAFEGRCCSLMFRSLRVHQNIRTRRKKNRPTHIPILAGATPHGASKEDIPVEQAPGVVVFPLYGLPQILLEGIEPTSRVNWIGGVVCPTTDDHVERQRKLISEGRPGVLAMTDFCHPDFLRSLAKIAHGYVVSKAGLNGFQTALLPTILGETKTAQFFVGGLGTVAPITPVPTAASELHQVYHRFVDNGAARYHAVEIRLFARLKPTPPVYLVIAGQAK